MNQTISHDNIWGSTEGKDIKQRFLGWLSSVGIGLLSLFEQSGESNTTSDPYESEYDTDYRTTEPPHEPIPACCHLFYNIDIDPSKECHYPAGVKRLYTCPEGYHQQHWTCVQGTQVAACAECTTSTTTCWSGSFQCSIWWWVGRG